MYRKKRVHKEKSAQEKQIEKQQYKFYLNSFISVSLLEVLNFHEG